LEHTERESYIIHFVVFASMRKRSRFYLDDEDEDRVTYDEFTNPADAVLKPDIVDGEDEFLDQEEFGFGRSRQSEHLGRRSIPDLPPSLYDLNVYEPQQVRHGIYTIATQRCLRKSTTHQYLPC
jgi:hypothetical protein